MARCQGNLGKVNWTGKDTVAAQNSRVGKNGLPLAMPVNANGADSKLSTPLSPTRGLLVRRTDKKRLAPDVSSPNGLGGSSPALAPASGSVIQRFQRFGVETLPCRTGFPAVP